MLCYRDEERNVLHVQSHRVHLHYSRRMYTHLKEAQPGRSGSGLNVPIDGYGFTLPPQVVYQVTYWT